MTILSPYPWLLLLLFASNYLLAQPIVKEKSTLIYTISSKDSLVRAQKRNTYDTEGRLLTSKNYYYDLSAPGTLQKEETSTYNTTTSILTETITRYITDQEPATERLETNYLVYAPKEQDSKRIWRRHFDNYGELTKEDTLTYNADQLVINNCQYNYMGSTSLLCEIYDYKDTLRTRWQTVSKWNTINGKSEVVEKQTRRRDYRYRYNRRGQLKAVRAKDYSNKLRRKLCYDKEGNIEEDHLIMKRKVTRRLINSAGEQTEKTRRQVQKTENVQLYEAGKLVENRRSVNGKEIKKETYRYQDSLLLEEKIFVATVLSEETVYTYEAGLLTEKIQNKYDPKGNLRFAIKIHYNDLKQAIAKEQIARNTVLSLTEWTYDRHGNVLEETTSRPIPEQRKKGKVVIDRPKEKIVYIYTYY